MSGKNLGVRRRIQQRIKGTHDSPCMAICTHKQGDVVCKGCGMLREEKRAWKRSDPNQKEEVRVKAKNRIEEVSASHVSSQSDVSSAETV